MSKLKQYDESFKREAVDLALSSNQSIQRTARELGVAQSSLCKWVRNNKMGRPALGKVRSNSQQDSIKACLSWLGAGCLVPDSEIMVPLSPPLLPISGTGWQFRRVGLRNK